MIENRTFLPILNWDWLFKRESYGQSQVELPLFIILLLEISLDLKACFPFNTEEDKINLLNWWSLYGKRAYPEFSKIVYNLGYSEYIASAELAHQENYLLPLPKALIQIWKQRPDLQKAYPLDAKHDNDLLFWWFIYGVKEYPFLKEAIDRYAKLHEDYLEFPDDTVIPLSKGAVLVWHNTPSLKRNYALTTSQSRNQFIYWWLHTGIKKYYFLTLTPKQIKTLAEPDPDISQDTFIPLSKGLLLIWKNRQDLQEKFALTYYYSRHLFLLWFLENQENKYTWLVDETLKQYALSAPDQPIPFYSEPIDYRSHQFGTYLPHGVNIAGFIKGELGLGEDTRLAALSLQQTEIPFVLYDVPLQLCSRADAKELEHFTATKPVFTTNLIFLPGQETFRLLLSAGCGFFNQRYNIGAWQWELPNWPKKLTPLFHMVQEIWASSHYIENMFLEATNKPVRYMPIAVEIPKFHPFQRSDFALPEDKFLFLVMFDGNSWITRKNPLGGIRAFLKAFPNEHDVALVIKTMNMREDHPDWKKLLEYTVDTRIIIFNETYTREKTYALINCCDVYVSLHRAEGFGRIMAEAMLLGKPVIASNFSGNKDFTNQKTAFMVDGPCVVLKEGDYALWEGQYWCDPNEDQAAEHMRTCFYSPSQYENISAAGKKYIQENYSTTIVGQHYVKRLRELNLIR